MSNPFGEVPALPAAVGIGAAALVALLIHLRASGRFTWFRAAVAAALAVYAAGIFANTVFPIYLDPPANGGWSPGLALIPLHDYEASDALMNIAVFVPLGILIPLVMSRPTWWKVLLAAVATSLGIELVQLAAQAFFAGGHIADVNDLLSNATGGMLGFVAFHLLSRIPRLSKIVDRFRLHAPPTP